MGTDRDLGCCGSAAEVTEPQQPKSRAEKEFSNVNFWSSEWGPLYIATTQCDDVMRKLSFGTQSVGGSRFVETVLSVVETCRQQQRNAFAFVRDCVQAHFARQASPQLLTSV